jgi:hypothetical protein
MPSKLKRRIPVIFSGVGASAGSASVASVGVGNIPPSWTDALGDSFSITAGVPFTYTFTAYDPNGDLIDILQNSMTLGLEFTENDQVGNYRTITIYSTAGLAAGTYTAELDLAELSSEVTTFTLSGGSAGKAWTFGHAFARGDIPSGFYVNALGDHTAFQAEPRNYWPDGSVKFAVLSGIGGTAITLHAGVVNVRFGGCGTDARRNIGRFRSDLRQGDAHSHDIDMGEGDGTSGALDHRPGDVGISLLRTGT